MLALGPRYLLYRDTAAWAIDAPHAVQEEHRNRPQRNKLESPLAKRVVAWALATTTAANRTATAVSAKLDKESGI